MYEFWLFNPPYIPYFPTIQFCHSNLNLIESLKNSIMLHLFYVLRVAPYNLTSIWVP